MSCWVKGCKSRRERLAQNVDNISFHRVPKSEPMFSIWRQACGRDDLLQCAVNARICSIHFEENMFSKSKRGTFLLPGAVPTRFFDQSTEVKEEMTKEEIFAVNLPNRVTKISCIEYIPVCRVCLKTDRRMFMLESDLLFVYQNVTNIQIDPEDGLPKMLCWECKHRVISCNQFTTLARNSNHLLVDLQNCGTHNMLKKIKLMNTEQISNLVQKTYPSDYCDYNIIENIESVEIEVNIQKPTEYIDVRSNVDDVPIIKDEFNNEVEALQGDNEPDKSDSSDSETIFNDSNSMSVDILTKEKDSDDEMFTTTKLTPEDQIKEMEKRKETRNYKVSTYKCDKCYKGFMREENYKRHMAKHTDQYGSLVCPICSFHFKNKLGIRRHRTVHTHRYSCDMCPYVTNLRQVAVLHSQYHKGKRYKCPKCEAEFSTKSAYNFHMSVKHSSDIVCQLCGFSFFSDKGLDMHKIMKHHSEQHTISDSSPLCADCDIRFASEEALQQHYRVSERHKDRNLNMQKRRVECKIRQPVNCEHCSRRLPSRRSYITHFRLAHPEKHRQKYFSMYKHMCEVCGRTFSRPSLLKDHMPSHSGTKQFQCTQCPKKFAQRTLLASHLRDHDESLRYTCAYCDKVFDSRIRMQRHATIHLDSCHKCEFCNKAFKQRAKLRKHINQVHLKKPRPEGTSKKTNEKENTDSPMTALSSANLEVMEVEVTWEG